MIKLRKNSSKCNSISIRNMQKILKEKQIRLKRKKVEKERKREVGERKVDLIILLFIIFNLKIFNI